MTEIGSAIEILLDGPNPALWEIASRREVMRFIRKRGKAIDRKNLTRLTKEIMAGPPREQYPNVTDENWPGIREHAIRLRLYKLEESGAKLSKTARKTLALIQQTLPWEPRGDYSEEFPFFSGPTTWADKSETGELSDFATMKVEDFIEWSETQDNRRWDCSGGWALFCEKKPTDALRLLQLSGERNVWPNAPWYDALLYFQKIEKKITKQHKINTAKILVSMPIASLGPLGTLVAQWLEKSRKVLGKRQRRNLWENIWTASLDEEWDGNLDYDETLNQAGGILASVLLDELIEYHPSATAGDNTRFSKALRPYFELIGNGNSPSAKLARICLSANLLYLFRVDQRWTEDALIKRMDIKIQDRFEAGLWEGYLWSPRIHDDLLEVLKPSFLRILENLDCISKRVAENAPKLFISIAVPPDRGVSTNEALTVLQNLTPENLAAAAEMLKDLLSSSGDKSPVLWRETIGPWFKKAWPKNANAKTAKISAKLASMSLATGSAFSEAVDAVEGYLQPEKWGDILSRIKKLNLQQHYPEASWKLIQRVIGEETQIVERELPEILEEIARGYPAVANEPYFQKLQARGNR
ncbi:MAG: hypothetical protein HOB79_07390 [Rhodospirillaceae bacterium]|nr:hypothetical protein [Rhodospirillaceae bacterium]